MPGKKLKRCIISSRDMDEIMVSTVDTKTLKILMLEGVFRVKKER